MEDLQNIKDYISQDSKRYAKIQVKKLKDRTTILKQHPFIGRIVPEVNSENIRELIEGNYRIIYKVITETSIDILTVHHSSRNFSPKQSL